MVERAIMVMCTTTLAQKKYVLLYELLRPKLPTDCPLNHLTKVEIECLVLLNEIHQLM